jgi:predicted RNase H-like nuclease
MHVVGVDGCPGGWIAVVWETETGALTPRFHPTFQDTLTSYPNAAAIGIDIPIGLRDDGRPRGCDATARKCLGWPRSASVFPAPQRRLLAYKTYVEALEASRRHFCKGISQQAFGIFPKVKEVDGEMRPELQRRVIEVHPEVSFQALARRKLKYGKKYSKKAPEGFEERRKLLLTVFGEDSVRSVDEIKAILHRFLQQAQHEALAGNKKPPKRSGSPDDYLDAVVAAWTAHRWAEGKASRMPAETETDERGLRMEIVV